MVKFWTKQAIWFWVITLGILIIFSHILLIKNNNQLYEKIACNIISIDNNHAIDLFPDAACNAAH